MDTLLVRLKPFDPRRGHVLRRYVTRGVKFHEERGWYRVPRDLAEYLRTVKQVEHDPHAAFAFDVGSEEEAKALDAREQAEAQVKKAAIDAVALTTEDLPRVARTQQPAQARKA
jgi:hypothetical protein